MNETEYHQAIYEAAKKVVEFYYGPEIRNLSTLEKLIDNLQHALEGKE